MELVSTTLSAESACVSTFGRRVVRPNPGRTKRPLNRLTGAKPGGKRAGRSTPAARPAAATLLQAIFCPPQSMVNLWTIIVSQLPAPADRQAEKGMSSREPIIS